MGNSSNKRNGGNTKAPVSSLQPQLNSTISVNKRPVPSAQSDFKKVPEVTVVYSNSKNASERKGNIKENDLSEQLPSSSKDISTSIRSINESARKKKKDRGNIFENDLLEQQPAPLKDVLTSFNVSTRKKEIVASIEIGDTFSGYVFCIGRHYTKDGLGLFSHPWSGNDGTVHFKIPSVILFAHDKTFHSFGNKAEETFKNNTGKNWFFFKDFMITLRNKNLILNEDALIEDYKEKNKRMKAVDVLGASISYLKESMLTDLKSKQDIWGQDDILWVLTAPSSWERAGKELMTRAAKKAGITEQQLIIIPEAEAAVRYCLTITDNPNNSSDDMSTSFRCVLLNSGAGTINLTVLHVDDNAPKICEISISTEGKTKISLDFLPVCLVEMS